MQKRVSVVDDYGPVGRGASAAHYVLAENGNEYIAKGPVFSPGHRYVAANELIVACLAGRLGLPVLDFCILEMNGQLFFGSSWMQGPSFAPQINEDLFNRCENRTRVYDLVVFDSWVCNVDRHHENLVVRCAKKKAGGGDHHLMLLNDHSHCLVLPGQTPASLPPLLDTPPGGYVRLGFVQAAVKERAYLKASLEKVGGIQGKVISDAVEAVPEEFLPAGERGAVADFLLQRQSRLRTVFRNGLSCFANLGGGTL
jgi:hypothetical protein